jgi:hypothetical protein
MEEDDDDEELFLKNRALYEIMWKNIVARGRPYMTIWRMRIVCWIPKATNTHSECVILIAFPLQQCLLERTAVLRNAYITSLVITGRDCVYCAVRIGFLNKTGHVSPLRS